MPLTKPPQRVADRPRRSQALHHRPSIDASPGPCLTRCLPICGVVSIDSHARRRPSMCCRLARPVSARRSSCPVFHWVELKPVAEITYLTWTADNLLRQTVYVGLREDKPAEQVRARRVKAAAGDPRLKRWLTLHGNAQDSRADAPGGDRQRAAKATKEH
jgi:hypothetical protein